MSTKFIAGDIASEVKHLLKEEPEVLEFMISSTFVALAQSSTGLKCEYLDLPKVADLIKAVLVTRGTEPSYRY